MKISNDYSVIQFDENKMKTENKKNLLFPKSSIKYNEIFYDSIKDMQVSTLKLSKFILFSSIILGFIFFGAGLKKKIYTNPYVPEYASTYIQVDTSTGERVQMFLFCSVLIGVGVYYSNLVKKRYDGIKGITVTYLDGKQKKINIFFSRNDEEIEQVKNKIESMIKDK
jgi:hypothetical protein